MIPAAKLELVSSLPKASVNLSDIFIRRGDDVIRQFDEALKPDNADGIHELRVAIRRFRTVIIDLSPLVDENRWRKLNKKLKRLAGRAGKVRENDVEMKRLTRLRNKTDDPQILEGIDMMLDRRKALRRRAFQTFCEHFGPNEASKVADKIRRVPSEVGDEIDRFRTVGRSVISRRVHDLIETVPAIYDPTDLDGHHLVRIAAKHLRYSVEVFEGSENSDQSQQPSNQIAKMQDRLGEVHDAAFWIVRLSKKMKRACAKERTSDSDFLAAEWLLGQLADRRATNYREALALWTEWRRTGFLNGLIS